MFSNNWIGKEKSESIQDIKNKYGQETSDQIYTAVEEKRRANRDKAWNRDWRTAAQEELEILQCQDGDIVSESKKIVEKNVKSVWGKYGK